MPSTANSRPLEAWTFCEQCNLCPGTIKVSIRLKPLGDEKEPRMLCIKCASHPNTD